MRRVCSARGMNSSGPTRPRDWCTPSHDGLDAARGAGPEVDLGLVVHLELPLVDGLPQLGAEGESGPAVAVPLGGVELAAGPGGLGDVHRDVRTLQHDVHALAVLRVERDPEARLHRERRPFEEERAAEHVEDVFGEAGDRLAAVDASHQHRELVPAESGIVSPWPRSPCSRRATSVTRRSPL